LRRYPELIDIIIFGSVARGEKGPKDVDIALLIHRKDFLKSKAINELAKRGYDVEVVDPDEMYKDRLYFSIVSEGFSIKEDGFLNKRTKIRRKVMFKYGLKKLNATQKVYFNRAIRNLKLEQVAPGVVMAPFSRVAEIDLLFRHWKLSPETKEIFFKEG
jgi:predicted nucleotidyltransferase